MGKVLIVGGGIIGLSLAYELAARGKTVTIVEQGDWGGQASSAAAGMLAPLKEFQSVGPLLDLGMESLQSYPRWVEELQAIAGGDVQLSLEGLLTVALDEEEEEAFYKKYLWQKARGYEVQWLRGKELQDVEPLLTDQAVAAIYSPGEGHINNRFLLRALVTACRKLGVDMRSGCVVSKLLHRAGCVEGVETSSGRIYADHTIICSGAWAGIMMQMLDVSIPVRPVRGQIAAVSSIGIPLRTVIFGSSGYLTPKKDGRIVIGATEDESGFQREVTLSGLAHVLQGALPYVPALHAAAFLEAWGGLRPATADGKPILGEIPGISGISLAGGHFRNGILLSVVTAKRMADWLETGNQEQLEPFSPGRFVTETAVPVPSKMG